MITREMIEIKDRHTARLMQLPNVVAVGLGFKEIGGILTDKPAVLVGVKKKKKPLPSWLLIFPQLVRRFIAWASGRIVIEDIVPTWLPGAVTDVVQWGTIYALGIDPTKRHRPARRLCGPRRYYSGNARSLGERQEDG